MLNINHVRVLNSIIVTGSTVSAAAATGLSQSGVSRVLAQLEREISLELFVRDKGRLVATPEAVALAREAESVLLAFDRLAGKADDLRAGAVGPETIRVGLPSSLWEKFAPALLVTYAERFPDVRIETFFESRTTIQRLLEQRVIDIGFLRVEGDPGPGIEMTPVAVGEGVCVLPPDHPLCSRERLTPEDLARTPLILIGRQTPNRLALDRCFAQAGVHQMVKIETHTSSSACAYVAHGLGVAIISSFYANLFAHLGNVQRPFLPRSSHTFAIALAAGVPLSVPAKALVSLLVEQIGRSQTDAS